MHWPCSTTARETWTWPPICTAGFWRRAGPCQIAALIRRDRPTAWRPGHGHRPYDPGAGHRRLAGRPATANLGAAYRAAGRYGEAEAASRRAIALLPDFAMAHINLGLTLVAQDRAEEAIGFFQTALQLQPGDADTPARPGPLTGRGGPRGRGGGRLRQMSGPDARVLQAIQLPLVYSSTADMHRWRTRLIAEVDQLLAEGFTLDIAAKTAFPVFSLAHQGLEIVRCSGSLRGCIAPRLRRPLRRERLGPAMAGISRRLSLVVFQPAYDRQAHPRADCPIFPATRFASLVLSIGSHSDDVAVFHPRPRRRVYRVSARPTQCPAGLSSTRHLDICFTAT